MKTMPDHKPLSEAELDRLGDLLKRCGGGKAMNLEQLDGFFAALVVGPEAVMPSEYLPEVLGGEMSNTSGFANRDEANEFFGLVMRHWNAIAGTLYKDEIYLPILLEDEHGVAHGNDWASGFMQGVSLRIRGWSPLIHSDDHGGCLLPMMKLAHEHDEDPELRPGPISPEKREEIIQLMTAGLLNAYRHFRAAHSGQREDTSPLETRRSSPKIGRNEPCPCGSGKKYKKCCGGTAAS